MARRSNNLEKVSVKKTEFDPSVYEYDNDFKWGEHTPDRGISTVPELIKALESNKKLDIDAIVIGADPIKNKWGCKRYGKTDFIEAWKRGPQNLSKAKKFRESGADGFLTDQDTQSSGAGNLIGDDFIPLLGGPFYKTLYYYDYIRAHNLAFWAVNHDPIARAVVNITVDFTLGQGFRVDSKNKEAMAYWDAFAQANELQNLLRQYAKELCWGGECLVWKLPNKWTKIIQQPVKGQPIPTGMIPRVRLIDPSVIWEIVTWPEDITNVLYYVWVAPTQWQMYTGLDGNTDTPGTKFIFQTIPADQVSHYKINSASNEKRGRSDLFPVFGDLKRLRDVTNYQVVSLMKQAAWSIDTSIDGSQEDIDNYIDSMNIQGTVANAGSDFVHTKKVERKYMSNEGMGGSTNIAFEVLLSKIAAGVGIPVGYFGTYLSGGQTKASAHVTTEPVIQKFKMRQLEYERMLRDLWDDVMDHFGLGKVECEITFPELLVQDRSAKLKDLALAEVQGWISHERASEIAAKELGITEYNYQKEQSEMKADPAPMAAIAMQPLTAPAQAGSNKLPQEKPAGGVPSPTAKVGDPPKQGGQKDQVKPDSSDKAQDKKTDGS